MKNTEASEKTQSEKPQKDAAREARGFELFRGLELFRPMKCENAIEAEIKFPILLQPKIDGVRGLNIGGKLFTRTMRGFANKATDERFSKEFFSGLDGELWYSGPGKSTRAGDTSQSLCRDTTSAMNSIQGSPDIHWTIFDDTSREIISSPYALRWARAKARVAELRRMGMNFIHIIDTVEVRTLEQLHMHEDAYLAQGYEGIILRSAQGMYKNGRATVREGSFLRIKRFVDSEALVEGLLEAEENTNEGVVNALGYLERSSHSENKIKKGMLGGILARWNGVPITIGPGELTHEERKFFWENPEKLIGKSITFKYFPHGMKDLPRFPTFKSLRNNRPETGEFD